MRIKIVFSYDGSKFCGFQRQKNERSVQKEIENALFNIYGKEILIKAAGRTDAGVHADGQVAHFDVEVLKRNLKDKLNDLLEPDIKIINLCKTKEDFHARHDVRKKEYIYKINLGIYDSKKDNYYLQPKYKIDIELLKETSKYFLGQHDFHNFVSGKRDNYKAIIDKISFNKVFDILEIHFIGKGFYRYMVRNLVGALLEVAKYNIKPDVIQSMLNNPDIEKHLPTAPPEGLYLHKIWY